MPTSVRSFCKINLGLRVGPARADGFHGLTTMYQTIGLHDVVTVSARHAATTRITLTANHPGVPRTETGDAERNTAYRMVAEALARLGVRATVEIDLDKKLPVQGGLGAGSANAVAALLGLERELGVALLGPERLRLAEEVGSDVPLFLLGGTVLGLGRGEQVFPLPDLPVTHCVVAIPGVGVSTAAAFRELDARMASSLRSFEGDGLQAVRSAVALEQGPSGPEGGPPGLKPFAFMESVDVRPEGRTLQGYGLSDVSMQARLLTSSAGVDTLNQLSRALAACYLQSGCELSRVDCKQTGSDSGIARLAGDLAEGSEPRSNDGNGVLNPLLALVRTGIENDFEEVAFVQHPSLRSTKRDLVGDVPGAAGSAVYAALSGSGSALFGLYRSLEDAQAAQQRVQRNGTTALLTETLSRAEYWERMFA